MIYLGFALGFAAMVPAILFGPWWTVALIAGLVGALRPCSSRDIYLFSLLSGLVWAALAFIKDSQSGGVISRRTAGLFQLPAPSLIFVLVFGLGFATTILSMRAGGALRRRKMSRSLFRRGGAPPKKAPRHF